MGRAKGDATRSKTRPSSSSLAAELLQGSSSSSGGLGPAIRFGGFGSGGRNTSSSQLSHEGDVSPDVDGEAALHLKRLSKKDPTTKLKALVALRDIFRDRPPSELLPILSSWVFIYKRLVMDSSRQVRESAHVALGDLARSVGRSLGPHLKSLMGAWWVAQFDPWKDVAEAARAGFQGAFPAQRKQLEALLFCREEIFAHLDENLKLTPQTIGDKTSVEEAAEKHERVLSSSLLAFVTLLEVLEGANPSPAAAVRRPSDGKDAEAVSTETSGESVLAVAPTSNVRASSKMGIGESADEVAVIASRVCQTHGFFKDLVRSKSPIVRGAVYQALRVVCERASGVVDENLAIVAPIILGAFVEKEAACHRAMWEMVLSFVKKNPRGWYGANMRKMVWPRLWAFLRHACYGSPEFSYPCMVVLLSMVPGEVIMASSSSAADFFLELLSSMWQGRLSCAGMAEILALLKALRECLLYVLFNANKYVKQIEDGAEDALQASVIKGFLFNMCWKEYVGRSVALQSGDVMNGKGEQREGKQARKSSSDGTSASGDDARHVRADVGSAIDGNLRRSSPKLSPDGEDADNEGGDRRVGERGEVAAMPAAAAAAMVRRMPPGWFRELGDWISNAISTIGARRTSFLSHFWPEVTSEYVAMVEEACAKADRTKFENGGKDDDAFLRLRVFYERLGMRRVAGGVREERDAWVLKFAVQPLVSAVFSKLVEMNHPPTIALLALIVRCYGPMSFATAAGAAFSEVSGTDSVEGSVDEVSTTRQFVGSTVTDWCLGKRDVSDTSDGDAVLSTADLAKIDLIAAFVRHPDMQEVWQAVIVFLTQGFADESKTVKVGNVAKLSMLLEGMGKEVKRFEMVGDGLVGESPLVAMEVQKRVNDVAVAVAGSQLLTSSVCGKLLRLLLSGEAKSKGIGRWIALSSDTKLAVLKLLLKRIVQSVELWPSGWALHAASFLGASLAIGAEEEEDLDGCEKKKEVDELARKVELGRAAMEVIGQWVMDTISSSVSSDKMISERVICAAYVVRWLRDAAPEKKTPSRLEDNVETVKEMNDWDDADDWEEGGGGESDEEAGEEDEDEEEAEQGQEGRADGVNVRTSKRKGNGAKRRIDGIADQRFKESLVAFAVAADAIFSDVAMEVLKAAACSGLRQTIRELLVRIIRLGLWKAEEEVEAGIWAKRSGEVFETLCHNNYERAELIDSLLEPYGYWPKWTAKPDNDDDDGGNKEKEGVSMIEFVRRPIDNSDQKGSVIHSSTMAAYVASLASLIGTAEVLGNSKMASDALRKSVTVEAGLTAESVPDVGSQITEFSDTGERNGNVEEGDAERQRLLVADENRANRNHADENERFRARSRGWLVVELLCAWEWPGGSAISDVLPFLVSGSCSENGRYDMAEAVVDVLFHKAAMSGTRTAVDGVAVLRDIGSGSGRSRLMGSEEWPGWMCERWEDEFRGIQEPFLRALVCVLGWLLRKGEWGVEKAWMIFTKRIRGASIEASRREHDRVIVRVLHQLMPTLRGVSETGWRETPRRSRELRQHQPEGLEGAVEIWLREALDSLDIERLGTTGEAQTADYVLRVVGCFPVHPDGGHTAIDIAASANISEVNKNLLLQIMRKQLKPAEVAVKYASRDQTSGGEECSGTVDVALSHLVAAAVAYCWKDFVEEDWVLVCSHIKRWLESCIVKMGWFQFGEGLQNSEEAALSLVPVGVATGMWRSELSTQMMLLPRMSCWVLSVMQAIQEDGGDKLGGEVSGEEKREKTTESLTLELWKEVKEEGTLRVLEILMTEGLTKAVDGSEGRPATSRHVKDVGFLKSLAQIAAIADNEVVLAAVQSMEDWLAGLPIKTHVDVISGLYALMRSRFVLASVQRPPYIPCQVSFSLLSRECLISRAVVCDGGLDMDDLTEEVFRKKVVLREEVMQALGIDPHTILMSSPTSSTRMRFFLTWTLLLGFMRRLQLPSTTLQYLSQYLLDSHTTSLLLDAIFQHIPLSAAGPSATSAFRGGGGGALGRPGQGVAASTTGAVVASDPLKSTAERSKASNSSSSDIKCTHASRFIETALYPITRDSVRGFACAIYQDVLRVLPACARLWFMGLREKGTAAAVEAYTMANCSPRILAWEFSQVQSAALVLDNLSIKANRSSREVSATYSKDEAVLEIVIRLPAAYPLRTIDVECTRRVGVSESRLRKWLLSISAFLRNQNGAVAEAIALWKQNVDREFEGVEECPICYSVIHTTNHSLPRLACKTCKHKFHGACLYKWFSSSHKSTCPLCQTPF